MRSENTESQKKSAWQLWAKRMGVGIIALFLFGAGVVTGNGSLQFSSTAHTSNAQAPENLDYRSVEQLYDLLRANYDGKLDTTKLLDGMKTGLLGATGDPYTEYFSTKDAKEFNEQLQGSFTGIGAELGKDEAGSLQIVSPIDGFPASKAGLKPKDIITSINGKTTIGMSVSDAVSNIRGPSGTTVTLRILRNKTQDVSFTITRAEIKLPSVTWELQQDDTIGYLQISQFRADTPDLVREAARTFTQKKVKGVILDLRGNPGGQLDAAQLVASVWLPEGKTVLVAKQGGVPVESYYAKGSPLLQGMPTAILLDGGSASASEIVAGALRDHKAATIYGEKSYGKGSVQQVYDGLPGDTEAKITIARWYRPNGQNIDKKGISPDHTVKLTDDDAKNGRDPQKDAALQFLQSKAGQ